ncbi:AraC family transcriptional regulator of adaptative response/methylated-DNA-[protein]-cysteine methyltransferase [Rubricella aquisinus]|uniref:methylated-DNA--[protein]-cysteine S-methyltransferase n=1 Tax=Rubricella aquisinus TaxID=2028108 RepID=A0A840WPV7_9RHOB|nr:trifunctional transcriptional activator/DNA repair protein Ada/methylated-DNA--[protein]-cysteine S-methyltransferase [Rubricella aquisinus]MBB5516711.1 AraC family transcriptional regulator of adaptative response/methylated-DNA-[protein]-cysteine methyltransferase [Rubricella aquisinus]
MLFDLPDDDTLYAALVARDPSYDGRAFVCVRTTGIFCRLTCPARNPKRENCTFQETAGACIAAGYRACKRCHPLANAALAEPHVAALLKALEARPTYRWGEGDVQRMGFDPSTVRRAFKRHFGMTFLDMARQTRLRHGFTAMGEGARVIDAQMEAGFASPSAFRAAFGKLMGVAPGAFRDDGLLRASWIDTPLGPMLAISDACALHLLEFMDRKALPGELRKLTQAAKGAIGIGRFVPTDQIERELEAYFAGRDPRFTVPLAMAASPFTRQVWTALCDIPAGQTRSYGDLAREIGRPTATRAVARANGANQIAIVIPCHRVIGQDGTLTGYGGGLWRKQRLIEIEQDYRTGEYS